jgi:hypothetical protein
MRGARVEPFSRQKLVSAKERREAYEKRNTFSICLQIVSLSMNILLEALIFCQKCIWMLCF